MNVASLLLKEIDSLPTFPKFPSGFANLDSFASQNFSNFNYAELCSGLEVYVGDQSLTEPEKKALIQEYFGGILFEDRNNNNRFDEIDGDVKLANIKLFASTDGAYLRIQHHNLQGKIGDNDIAVFLELPSGDKYSGGLFCAILASEAQTKNAAKLLNLDWSAFTNNSIELQDYQFNLLLKSLYSKQSFWEIVWLLTTQIILQPILEIAQLGNNIFTGIGNFFGGFRIGASAYDPDNEAYNRVLVSEILKPYLNVKGTDVLAIFEKLTKVKLPEILKQRISGLFDLSNGIVIVLLEIIESVSEFLIGVVCGIWNSFIDLIVGIFELIALVFKAVVTITKTAIHADYYWKLLLEYADNFVQYVAKIDWKDVIISSVKGAIKVYESLSGISGAMLKGIANVNFGEMGYYTGYILFEVVQLFFPVLELAKLGKLGKLSNLDDIIKAMDIFSDGKKVSKNSFDARTLSGSKATTIMDSILAALDYFNTKLKAGTSSFIKWIDEIFERIKKWLGELFVKAEKIDAKSFNKFRKKYPTILKKGDRRISKEYFSELKNIEKDVLSKAFQDLAEAKHIKYLKTSKAKKKLAVGEYVKKLQTLEINKAKGKLGEKLIQKFTKGKKIDSKPFGIRVQKKMRFPDLLNKNTIMEVKSGGIKFDTRTIQQIDKDLTIISDKKKFHGHNIKNSEWHSFGEIDELVLQYIEQKIKDLNLPKDCFTIILH